MIIETKKLTRKIKKEDFFAEFEDITIKTFHLQKGIDPTVAVLDSTGEVTLFIIDIFDQMAKQVSHAIIKQYCANVNAVMCCFASEAWGRIVDENDEETKKLISELGVGMMNDRKEILMLNFDSIEMMHSKQIIYDIIRNEDDIILNKTTEISTGQTQGLMINLLNKNFN